MLSKIVKFPLGPVFLIAVIPYHFWAIFDGTFPLWQAHRAAAIAGVGVLSLTVALSLLTGTITRAGTQVALLVAILLAHSIGTFPPIAILAVIALAMLIDRRRMYDTAAIGLNVLGIVLLGGALQPVAQFIAEDRALIATEHAPLGQIELIQSPSIIHIVLDGYGAPDILAELYHHDTGPFINALKERGFIVMPDVVTPYSQTLPTMASILSGDTVDLTDRQLNRKKLRRDLGHMVGNGPVVDVFRKAGYSIAASRSGYHYVDFEPGIEIASQTSWVTGFEANVLPVFLGPKTQLHGRLHNDGLRSTLAPGTLDNLPKPYFYYQHVIAPHPPFSINADGSDRSYSSIAYVDGNDFIRGEEEKRSEYLGGYRQKALYVENALISQIDGFPAGPKIIIIHGDHGPGAFLDHNSGPNTCLAERLTTFAAVYSNVPEVVAMFEEHDDRPFYLVNLYRLIFASLSKTDIALLPTRARHLRWADLADQTAASTADLGAMCTEFQTAAAN